MSKENRKSIILNAASKIVRKNGFNNTGIQEILDAASIPKGSFYYYFKSKEDLGLHLIEYYYECFNSVIDEYLLNDDDNFLNKIELCFRGMIVQIEKNHCEGGCGLCNFAQEMSDINENFRTKLQECFESIKKKFEYCLSGALKNKEISSDVNINEAASFIVNAWEGSIMHMKVVKNIEPLNIFEKNIIKFLRS